MNGALVLAFNRILQALPVLVSAIIFLGTSPAPAGAVPPSEMGGKSPASVSSTPEKRLQLQETFGRLPLVFVENRGQTTSEVRFYHQGRGLGAFFTSEGIFWKVKTDAAGVSESPSARPNEFPGSRARLTRDAGKPSAPRYNVVRMTPVGMNPAAQPAGLDPIAARANYFRGNDPGKWRADLPLYGSVAYQEVYPGVDLKFYGQGSCLEYDVIVKPGADPSRVKFRFEGLTGLSVTPQGDLVMALPGGKELRQQKPLIYQEINGRRLPREGKFVLSPDDPLVVGFQVAAYDPNHPLIIDPVLSYSTFLGGSLEDTAWALAVDNAGCAYLTGITYSSDFFPHSFPGASLQQENAGDSDVFVVKLGPKGALMYMTYLGGSEYDIGWAIAVDAEGNAYIAGQTLSENFPIKNAFQPTWNGNCNEAFVTKLSPWGNSLVYSTYLGGETFDAATTIAVDDKFQVWVAGNTVSEDFPLKKAKFTTIKGGLSEIFITKFAADGQSLIFSTFLGGSGSDHAGHLALDSAGNGYLTGNTDSQDFFTTLGVKFHTPPNAGVNAFVCKISPLGAFLYSTYLGGAGGDTYGNGIAVDAAKNAYVTGLTTSPNFPTTAAAFSKSLSDQITLVPPPKVTTGDVFVTKFNSTAKDLVYSTYLGGNGITVANAIALDSQGNAYIAGETYSEVFPLYNQIQNFIAFSEAFVTKLNAAGSDLEYSTMLGGNSRDAANAIGVNSYGEALVGGGTFSGNFPTTANSASPATTGVPDGFAAKLGEVSPNSWNIELWNNKALKLKLNTLIPVTILSSPGGPTNPGFDATKVNPLTVTLAGAMVKSTKGRAKFSFTYANRDLLRDLVVYVPAQYVALQPGENRLAVAGRTLSGDYFEGVATVEVVLPRAAGMQQ